MNQQRVRKREPPQGPPRGSYSLSNSHYGTVSSARDARPWRRRVPSDDLKNLKIKAPEFDGA